jgi:hypothetical protein
MDDFKELRQALVINQSINKHPWHWDADPVKGDPLQRTRCRITTQGRTITTTYYTDEEAPQEAELITQAVNAAPALLRALDDLKQQLEDAERQHDITRGDMERTRIVRDEALAQVEALTAERDGLRADAQWQPIETAPKSGLIRLSVSSGEETRVFAAEASNRSGVWVWMVTTSWNGWTLLHPSWTPVGWLPMDGAMKEAPNV